MEAKEKRKKAVMTVESADISPVRYPGGPLPVLEALQVFLPPVKSKTSQLEKAKKKSESHQTSGSALVLPKVAEKGVPNEKTSEAEV